MEVIIRCQFQTLEIFSLLICLPSLINIHLSVQCELHCYIVGEQRIFSAKLKESLIYLMFVEFGLISV